MRYRTLALFTSLALLLASSAAAQTSSPDDVGRWDLPETPAGRRVRPLLKVIGGGDEAAIRQFLGEHVAPSFRDAFPVEQHVGQFRRMQRLFAGMQLAGVDAPDPNSIELVLKAGDGKAYKLSVEVEAGVPQRIASIGFAPAEAPAGPRFSSYGELDEALRRMAEGGRFSGVVLVTRGDTPVFRKAYGLADRASRLANHEDTMFDIGSINKDFTAVAVARLAQEGRLNLDDSMGKYLKGLPPEIGDKVTIRHLLQHRSGMGDYMTHPSHRGDRKRFRTVSDYMEIIRNTPLKFEPGTSQAYSNTGYVALGAVIEAVTNRSYYDVIQDLMYRPAGMKSSGSFDRTQGGRNMAIGYTRRSPQGGGGSGPVTLTPNTHLFSPTGSPAGGGFSTAADLKRFADALFGNRLLDRRHTTLFLNRFDPQKGDLPKMWGSAGGSEGVNAVVLVDAQTNHTVIVLANLDEPVAEEVGRSIVEQLRKG
ncbi:MAG: serine hydrolase domain-containing protein [Pyrinomonadaceae bacterium]